MGFFAWCQFLPFHHLETFEEMFLTGFFTNGLVIFNPFNTNPTYRYIAHKDVEEGDPLHALNQEGWRHRTSQMAQDGLCYGLLSTLTVKKRPLSPVPHVQGRTWLRWGGVFGPRKMQRMRMRIGPHKFLDLGLTLVNILYFILVELGHKRLPICK